MEKEQGSAREELMRGRRDRRTRRRKEERSISGGDGLTVSRGVGKKDSELLIEGRTGEGIRVPVYIGVKEMSKNE